MILLDFAKKTDKSAKKILTKGKLANPAGDPAGDSAADPAAGGAAGNAKNPAGKKAS